MTAARPALTRYLSIQKIRDCQIADPATPTTLQALIRNETAAGKHTAAEGLLWLNRFVTPSLLSTLRSSVLIYPSCSGLTFTCQAIRTNHSNPTEELSVSFTNAYGSTLKKHHNMFVKGVFSLAMKACPYRADFYKKLGANQDKVSVQLEEWLTSLELCCNILGTWIESVKW